MNAIRLCAAVSCLTVIGVQAATLTSKVDMLVLADRLRIDEASVCYSRMMSGTELGPLVGKVQLPMTNAVRGVAELASKATALEQAAIQRWRVMLGNCFKGDLDALNEAGLLKPFGSIYSRGHQDKMTLLSSLADRKLTFAEFNGQVSTLNALNLRRLDEAREAFRQRLYHVERGGTPYPLWEGSDLIPQSQEELLLSTQERLSVAALRRDNSHLSVRLFMANVAALNSNAISVALGDRTYRFSGSMLESANDGTWTWSEGGKPASGKRTTRFTWSMCGNSSNGSCVSGQVVVGSQVYDIKTVGRFQALLSTSTGR